MCRRIVCVAVAVAVCGARFVLIHHSNNYVENVFHINSRRTIRKNETNEKRHKSKSKFT